MNDLAKQFGNKLVVLAFPCNQFGHQENTSNEEILNSLKHVRPGNGFVPTFPIFTKREVNGANTDPIFSYLKSNLPAPCDNTEDLMGDPKSIIWSPVRRTDVSWNFEKFLIDKDGNTFKRYSRNFLTSDIAKDISTLV